jgi:nicotinamidase-related amidase
MRGKNPDLHGAAPDSSPVGLLIIDMLSDFEFEGSDQVFDSALQAARQIAQLKKRARAAGIPTIYVSDNSGRWQSSAQRVVEQSGDPAKRGHRIGTLLRPSEEDYFVLKPKHSAFFATPLELLLSHLGANALILTGSTSTQCILFTAIDAYVRDFSLYVPSDCIASGNARDTEVTHYLFENTLKADVRPASKLRVTALRRKHASVAKK